MFVFSLPALNLFSQDACLAIGMLTTFFMLKNGGGLLDFSVSVFEVGFTGLVLVLGGWGQGLTTYWLTLHYRGSGPINDIQNDVLEEHLQDSL